MFMLSHVSCSKRKLHILYIVMRRGPTFSTISRQAPLSPYAVLNTPHPVITHSSQAVVHGIAWRPRWPLVPERRVVLASTSFPGTNHGRPSGPNILQDLADLGVGGIPMFFCREQLEASSRTMFHPEDQLVHSILN